MAKAGIYLIFCKPTGEKYVGSSIDLPRRFKEHRYELRHGLHDNPRLMAEWEHHTEDGFEFSILERVVDLDQLLVREQYWMDTLKPTLNIAPFAIHPALGTKHSQESKDKMSASGKRAHDNHSLERKEKIRQHVKDGWKAWWDSLTEDERLEARKRRSRPHTDETKRRLSEASKANNPRNMLGKHHTDETKAKLSAALTGRKMPPITDAQRKQRSERMTGRKLSPETIQKLVDSHKGKKLTEEHKQKLRDAHKGRPGRPTSDETKEKLRQIALAQQADPEYLRKHDEGLRAAMNTPEMHEKLSKAHKGKTLSAEQREKIRLSNVGKHGGPRSEEAKRRMSEAQQKRRARDKQK